MNQGICIAFEGIDGSGKSTHSKLLADFLSSTGREVLVEHEPTNGPWGQKVRDSGLSGRLSAEEELHYFLNDRRDHVSQVINPALKEGKIVVLDRYYFSNMAYQGSRGLDPEKIRKENEDFAPVPDLLLIMDLDVDAALLRIGERGLSVNEFEKKEDLQKCRDIFLSLSKEPFVAVINSDAPFETVSEQIKNVVRQKGWV